MAWHNTLSGLKGPLRDIADMSEYTGMILGITVGEVMSREQAGAPSHAWPRIGVPPSHRGHSVHQSWAHQKVLHTGDFPRVMSLVAASLGGGSRACTPPHQTA